MREAVNLLTD